MLDLGGGMDLGSLIGQIETLKNQADNLLSLVGQGGTGKDFDDQLVQNAHWVDRGYRVLVDSLGSTNAQHASSCSPLMEDLGKTILLLRFRFGWE